MPPWLIPLLIAVGGGMANGAAGGNINKQIGSASEVKNTNPMTTDVYQLLNQITGQYSPENNLTAMPKASPIIQGLVGDLMKGYATNAQDAVKVAQQNALDTISNQYAGAGALQSGPALAAIAKGVAEPAMQSATELGKTQAALGSDILSRYMGERANRGAAGLQGMTAYAAPEWWQPTYSQEPNDISRLLNTMMPMLGTIFGGGGK